MAFKYGILGLLAAQPLHAYSVKARFEDLLGGSWEVNIGQVSTTLQRLERDGLVEPAAARGERGRLPYRLTEAGQKALEAWLAEPESEPQQLREEIYLKLLLASRVANGDLTALLARQRRVYLQRLKDLAVLEQKARAQGRDDLVLLYKGAVLHTEADLKWVDVCAEEIKTGSDRR
ncbi:MAG TPA: helix-turn-helix transcriptional regulator [Candidatus Limnocylindrales bacterium]|nr:helix-turn-helix transcriptional regulator [Candidatus Limnocylindrales bacterium]